MLLFIPSGAPLSWSESKKVIQYVSEHGIDQFLHIYNRLLNRENDCLIWGDEVEYIIVTMDHATKKCRLSLRAQEILDGLNEQDEGLEHPDALWRPEYASYMIEGTPGTPYGSRATEFTSIQSDMKRRRDRVKALLKEDEILLTIVNFPRLGAGIFAEPWSSTLGPNARSIFVPDDVTNVHPRFQTLTANIRERKGEKVNIQVPIFMDKNTDLALLAQDNLGLHTAEGEQPNDAETKKLLRPGFVYMDCMAFGMGCNCLQVTFQTRNVDEARSLYDSLVPIAPILLALTAGCPIVRGYLADIDCRWDIISASVDDRTQEEMTTIPKSRYASVSSYLKATSLPGYNDVPHPQNAEVYQRLKEAGVDDVLARHYAHYWIRDPLVIYQETLHVNDETHSDHFENIQSTNWQTVRFKPPPPNTEIGWRVEFRPMEIQLTDFENAAFTAFVALLTRAIISYKLHLYMPISLVDENMKRAQKRDAIGTEKFHFRASLSPTSGMSPAVEMSLGEIMLGKGSNFPGLLELVESFLDDLGMDFSTRVKLQSYMDFIRERSTGKLVSNAAWIRNFVQTHPAYKHDSIVTDEINYDLCRAIDDICEGRRVEPTLHGEWEIK